MSQNGQTHFKNLATLHCGALVLMKVRQKPFDAPQRSVKTKI